MLNTSIHGFHHPLNDRTAFDDSPEERRAFFEKMWASPGFMKFTSNYIDLLDRTPRPTPSGASSSPARSAASSTIPTPPSG